MQRFICLVALVGLCFPVFAVSDTSSMLIERTIPIATLSDTDFSGFERLKSELDTNNVRIFLLGEQTHGGGVTFEGKIKLIKYLHEHAGFDALAFESSLFGMAWAAQQVQSDLAVLRHHLQIC